MVNISPINCSNERAEYHQKFEKLLNGIFNRTSNANAHILYDFISPTNQLGKYDFLLFVDVPYAKGNFYRNKKGIYLNSLAIAVRKFEEPEIIDVDENCFYTEEGSWEYIAEMESDRQALRSFVYENFKDVKHFDVAMTYVVKAPKCNKIFRNNKLCFNTGIKLWEVIDNAITSTQNKKGIASNCLIYEDKNLQSIWSDFIPKFIDLSEDHTNQGILTKKKINHITNKKLGRLMEQAKQSVGNKLCVIRGKAGTGKTLALLRLMYEEIKKGDDAPKHNCRLLTFNNMLVMDLRQILKSIGDFTPTKASISTLHKFFYDIYKNSPVRYLHMDSKKINSLFNLCMTRTLKFNSLMQAISVEHKSNDMNFLIDQLEMESLKESSRIKEDEKSECKEYKKYLLKKEELDYTQLTSYAQEYVEYKRKTFLDNYHRQEFLNGYNVILEELYLIFHNLDDFLNKYNLKTAYSDEEMRNSAEFELRYQELYNQFMNEAGQLLQNEYGNYDSLIPNFLQSLEALDIEAANEFSNKSEEEQKRAITKSLKKIKRKVNWSKLIMVDEAQDCQVNEKALILELIGSDNTVIATGGRDQLIRTSQENDWSQLFGHQLDVEKIRLRSVSYRQKGNIIKFLNAFAEKFGIETRLAVPDETVNSGRVIIDCRSFSNNDVPLDKIQSLHMYGKDMGCTNFENMMFLLPQTGYVRRTRNEDQDVTIDNNSTILISQASAQRSLAMSLPSDLRPIDGTVNDKRKVLQNVGQDNTRCLLYESCRGLEAWNVMCMDLNDFYYEKLTSTDAEEYANIYAGGLLDEGRDKYIAQYASLWCFMAMTRAIDTLYIKLSNTGSAFSQKILESAQSLPQIEILEGIYDGPAISVPKKEDSPPLL